MATRLYLRDTVAGSSPTTGEKSASRTHSGTSTPAQNLALDTVKGAAQTSNVVNSSAATTNQNVYMGRWSWPLQTGFTSIAAQTWTYAFRTAEGNAAANSFASLCLYIWRPSNNSVVGYIYDTDSQLGVEATGSGQVVTFSGSAVTGQAGDLLVLEAWTDQTQSMATNYANTFYYNGATDVVAGTNADAAAYIESPANLIAAAATYTQSAYRFRYDDGTETTATWRAANNTAINMVADKTLRLRFNIASATSAPTQNKTFQLRYARNGSPTYVDVNASSLYARSSASPNVADATATTEQMAGAGTFNAGTFDEVDGLATGYTAATATGQDTEVEYSITVRSADVVAGDTLDFRLYSGGSAIDTYSQTPRITVVANSAGEARVPMTDPSTTLATGAGSGEIRLRAKKSGAGPTNPQVRVEVHDGDSATVLATPIANTQVSATGTDGELLIGTFDQSVLTTPNTTKLWIVTTNVVGASVQPLALEWNAAVASGATRLTVDADLRWAVSQRLTKDTDLRWKVAARLTKDADLRWAVSQRLTKDADLRWQVKQRLTQDADLRWKVATRLSKDADLRWAVAARLAKDADLRWKVAQRLAKDADLRWVVYQRLTKDTDLRWVVYARLSADADLRWKVAARLTKDADLRWAVYARLSKDADLRWKVAARLSKDADLRWRVAARLSQDADLRWQVLSTTPRYTVDIDLRWKVAARLTKDADLRWKVAARLTKDADLRWQVFQRLTRDADLRWRVAARLAQDADLRWKVRERLFKDAELQWAVYQRLAQDVDLRWAVESAVPRITKDIDLRWRVAERLTKDADLRWAVEALILEIIVTGTTGAKIHASWVVAEKIYAEGAVAPKIPVVWNVSPKIHADAVLVP